MTDNRDDDADGTRPDRRDETPRDGDGQKAVGYRRPPKSGQFRKGQSGNPAGRPRKPKRPPKLEPARFPTAEVLRAEAMRVITVNDARGRQELTVTEGVVRAMGLAALRGGVLAQRTYLEHQKAEDERLHAERKQSYAYWDKYRTDCWRTLAAARAAGRPEPKFLPHPDDIELDPWSLTTRFLGAVDKEGRAAEKQVEAFLRLGFEMAVYLNEPNTLPLADGTGGRLGFYMGLHLFGWLHLPPRLRASHEALAAEVEPKLRIGIQEWGDDLEQRCAAGNVPFVRWHPKLRMPTTPIPKWVVSAAGAPARVNCSW